MNKRLIGFACIVLAAVGAAYFSVRTIGDSRGAAAQSSNQRSIPVEVATAVRKKAPVRIDALGNVTPMASVAIRARLDSEIVGVHFADGAQVKKGDTLITLDKRSLDAQVQVAEGVVARDQAQLEGAERDVRRYTDLVSKNATPTVNLDNAKTQAGVYSAALKADQAQLENLKVQLSYTTIRAPISGRISAAALKVGNVVRTADVAPIATIVQTAPIYVTFSVAQNALPDIRRALAAETATVDAAIPGESRHAAGAVTMIENAVDPATGMVVVRATMPNENELLWSGSLVTVQLTLREDDAVVVPSAAIQVSQQGSFVFVVKDGVASVRPVKVARAIGSETVIESGLEANELVVTDGFLLLTNGAKVTQRQRPAGT